MPIYKVNGKTYDIPEEKVARFETAYPDAVVGIYDGGTGKEYEMPVSKVDKFKKAFPEWSYSRPAASGTSSGEGQEADSPGIGAVTDNVGTSGDERESTSGNKEGWKPTPIQKALMTGGIQASMARFDAKVDEGKRHLEEMAQYTNSGAAMTGGQVRDAGVAMDTGTGEAVKRYQTPTGGLTTDRVGAEREASAYREALDELRRKQDVDKMLDEHIADATRRRSEKFEEDNKEAFVRKDGEGFWNYFFRVLGNNPNTQTAAVTRGVSLYDDSRADEETNYVNAELRILEEAKRLREAQKLKKGDGFWDFQNIVNFGQGVKDVVRDVDTYAGGTRGLHKTLQVLDLKEKAERGEELSEKDMKLAEALMIQQGVESSGDTPHGYNAGRTTAEMGRFMVQMAMNPTSGLGKAIATKAVKKFGEKGAKAWAAKVVGTVAGDIGSSVFLANTLQMPTTLADIGDRQAGEVLVGDDGIGFVGGEGLGKAIFKGEASAVIENYTEMLGEHFGVIGNTINRTLGTGIRKIGGGRLLDSVSELTTRIGSTKWAQGIANIERRAQWNGPVGEMLEEEAGIVLNSAITGDNSLSDLVDVDQQIDIALGVGLFGGFVSGIKTVGYPIGRYRRNQAVKKADVRGGELLGEDWMAIRESIDGASESELPGIVKGIIAEPQRTPEQRKAVLEYVLSQSKARGYNQANASERRVMESTGSIETQIENAYDYGYDVSDPEEMNHVKKMLDLQRQRLASSLSEDAIMEFDEDPIKALAKWGYDHSLHEPMADYVNAKMVYDGMIQRVRDDIDGRIARSDAMIDSRINRETGMLQPATVRDVDSSDGRRVYIVNGSVAMYDDGTGVDARKSSESIIIRDAETGKVEFADPAQFLGVDEAVDAEAEKEAAREQIRQEMAQAAANSIDGVLSMTPGDTYSILDAEGNQQPVTVLGNSVDEEGLPVDGSVDVQYADGTIQSVVTSELQQMVDAASTQRVEQFDQEREAQRATAEEATQQAAQSGLSNPNRRTDLMPDDYEMPYDNRPVRASRYIESEKGTGGTLYQDENGNDAVVIAAIDDNNYVGYFREYDEQGNPTNRWSAKFQNGSGMRENHRDMMLTAQELLPAGHELTEHTSVSTDGLRNLANQLKHGYELQYDEQGNIITTEVAVNMMARENELGLSDYVAGSIDPARVTSEEYKEAAARLIPYMEALGLSKFNIHWEDGTLYVDHPILRRADTPQQEVEPTVTENAETVLNSAENTEIPTENRDLSTESVPKTDMPVENVQQTADDGFIPIDPEIKPDENGVINIPSPGTTEGDTVLGAEASEPTALSRVPTDERGEPVYEDAEPDTAWDALVEQSEGDEDIAMEVAADIVAEKEKEYKAAERALKKAIEGKPETARGDGELTMAERIAAKKASKTAIVKARGDVEKTRSVLEHWQLIAGTMQRRVDAEKNAALQEQQQWEEAKNRMDKRVRETSEKYRDLPEVLNILEQTDPQSIDEVAAWVLSRYKVLWGSRRNGDTGNVVRAGVQHHTGIGEGERRRLFGLFASEANGGRSIESLAEDVFEEACNQFGVAYDNGQALDALIDVIKGATTRSDITNYIVNNRIARAETEGDALHRYYEDAEAADREYHERYGMGETEWMEFYASHGAEIELPDDVFQELMTNLGGLKADEEYERGEIQESAADTTGGGREESVYTEGTGVGSERWLDDHGDASRRETEGGTTRGELVQDSLDEGGGEQSEVRGNDENGEEDVFSRMERIARNETLRTDIRDAEAEVNTEPTDKQKEAGNYKKGHVQVGTFDVTIENPKGSKRSGRDTDGKQWETTMTHTYGYIRGTKGVDGDHIDVYLSSDIDGWNGRKAFVVDQYNPDGSFDEHKVMLGFNDKDEAFEAYLSNYETGWDNGRRLDVTAVNLEDFEKWIDSSKRKTKPIADYVNIKKAVSASSQGSVADYKSGNNDNQSYSLINVVRDLYSKGKEYASRLYQRSFFNVAKTPEFMKTLGLTGNNFTIRYGVIARHFGKDGSHDISEDGWEKLPDALTKPFAITKLSDKDKGFRLYTTLQNHNGEYIVVGVDVKNVGRDLEVNAIATVFGRRDNAGTTLQEEIIYTDKNITPEQQSLLDGPNSHQYTAERELSKDKVNALSANKQTDSKESSDGYRIEPKPYTNKHGKTLDTYLVTFNRDFFVGTKRQGGFSKQEKSSLRSMAKDKKGWYDKETGGWMLRSREDAEVFARTVMSKNGTQLSEEAPLSLDDMQSATKQASEEISPIKLETTPTNSENSSPSEETPVKEKTVNPSRNKLVTDEQYAELLAKMRKKMGGQLNMGVDPEILAIGSMMAVYHIEKGARKFAEYVKAMVADLGEKFPARYLKGFYKAAHEMIEDAAPEIAEEMDSDDIVNTADVASIISGHIDAMVTAEMVIEEEKADKEREEAEQKLKDERNIRFNPDGTTTETVVEGGTEIAVTKGDFIPGVRPAADNEKKAEVKKRPGKSKPKPGTDGGLFDIDEKETASVPSIIVPESRPAADLMGDSSAYQDREAQTAELVEEIGGIIESRVMMLQLDAESVKPLTMTEVKKIATKYSALKDISDTDLQELVELAMTQLTRSEAIVNVGGTAEQQRSAYDHIVNLYQIQPSLNARDSERLIKQQYSTPTPFGYVMGQFVRAGGKAVGSMLEPSAGNGALTITVHPSLVHVNDIDEARLANLRKLGYGQVTAQDALLPFTGDKVDVVMTNPPFGTVTEKVYDGVFHVSSLEGQMAINALDKMKDDGRAAIVIGGNTSYRTNGSMNPKDAAFFGYLYSHYNVADVINISGKSLYSRNGTGYDVRMILIDGRKTGEFQRVFPPVKAKGRAEQVTTFDELYKRVQDDIQQIQQVGSKSADVQREPATTTDGTAGTPIRSGSNRPNSGTGQRPGTTSDAVGDSSRIDSGQSAPVNDGSRAAGVDNAVSGDAGSTDNVPQPKPRQSRSVGNGSAQNGTGRGGSDGRGAATSRPDSGTERLAVKTGLGDEKVPYPNQSGNGFTLMSVVPAAQAQALQKSLGAIGDVDRYLVDELGYSSKEELYGYLAAEQIDSVALAIHQMNNGNAFIIGDMTGVGKGRQGAALIRYGVKQGKVPIYFTQKPTLFTDNYRDLADIGSSDLRPFIIASNPKDANIVDGDGNIVHKLPSKKEQERVFAYIMEHGTLPDEYDYVLTTYDQIKNGTADYVQKEDGTWNKEARKLPKKSKGYTTADYNGQTRRDALVKLAEGNIAILDESHTVGGDSGCGRYMQMLTSSAGGVTFLSATFAKRADNMPIYAQRTAIAEAEVKASELIDAIMKGGVTLQEIMSKQLVESGQMIRRERSFEGVTIDWLSVEEETDRRQRAQFDEVAAIFNAIRNFQDDYITPIIDAKNEAAAERGATVGHTQGTKDMGVKNVPFASKMYNLVNQLLFALKVDAVADRVVENLRNGYKPVISFTNTMEGFLSSAPKGVAMDDVPNFSLTLMRALDGVMRFTEKDADENTDGGSISLSELSAEGQNAYNAIRDKITNLSADLPISPMDAIRMKIEEAGYSVAEITGRTMQLNRTKDGKYIVETRKDRDKKAAMRDFNSGKLDVLMINKSGSTGISLHASSKFEDQRQRVMVFAQFQSDINDEVQMRGRIDRSGQVTRGRYEYIMSTIPAEQRIQMMFKAKLKSLDANTTSSQKSKFNEMEIVDYLNKYGDEVVWEYMKEHPELEERLGDPLDMLQEKSAEDGQRTSEREDTSKKTGCAGKISRYLAFLSVDEQDEIFKEITEAYSVKIQLLDDAGENDLEITTMPLRAETNRKQIWHDGVNPGSGNAFADNTYVEEVEVDVLKKPMKRDEIIDAARKLAGNLYSERNGVMDWEHYAYNKWEEIHQFYQSKANEALDKLKEAGEARIAKAREKAVTAATKARGRGDNNFTDEEIQSLADTAANEEREKEELKQNKRHNEIMGVNNRIQSLLNRLRAGSIYVVPQDLKQGTAEMFSQTFGSFVGFKFNKSYTLGSSTAIFATLDGRRKVELALSDPAINTIISATEMTYRYSPKEINAITIDNWDSKVPTQTRQKRYIITGNLLQALVDTEKGEKTKGNLISYSTIDGETRQGILMGENFKLTDLRNSVSLSSRLAQIREGKAVVSENGDVQISKEIYDWRHRGKYELRVPKSKQRGGIYTMRPELLKLVEGNNFITKGGNMVAYVTGDNIAKVVDMLSRAPFNLTVLQESKLTEAEDEVRYRIEEDDTRYRISGLEDSIVEYLSEYNSAEVVIIEGATDIEALDLPADVISDLKDCCINENTPGVYCEVDKKIYIFANKDSGIDIKSVLLHENIHAIIDSLDDGRDEFLDNFMHELSESPYKGNLMGRMLKLIQEKYEQEDVANEYLTYMLQYSESNPGLRKAVLDSLTAETSEYLSNNILNRLYEKGQRDGREKEKDSRVRREEISQDNGIAGSLGEAEGGEALKRDGEGAYSDAEVSMENDPWSKAWGESLRSKREEREFARRERRRMVEHIGDLADKLNLRNVEIVTDTRGLEGRKARAKGFFDKRTGKITVVIPNNVSVADVEQTLLHEAVAHYGLRQLLGEHFDEFLDKVYEAAENGIKEQIDLLATRNGWNRRVATEEYLAGLAEKTDFSDRLTGWFTKVKRYFVDMLRKIGFKHLSPGSIGDNELRYILWRSYENLANPGRYRAFEWEAQDVAMKYSLGLPTGYREIEDGGNRGVADSDGLDELNKRFNEELEMYKKGGLPDNHRFELGMPSAYLKSAGFPMLPISMRVSLLSKKSALNRHPFEASDLNNLVHAIRKPIAIFTYTKDDMRNLIVDVERDGKQFLVGVTLNYKANGIEINSVSGLFPKDSIEWLKWIQDGKAIRIDKKSKVREIIDSQRTTNTVESERIGLNLDYVTKIVENFENPAIREQNNNAEGDEDVRFSDGLDELNERFNEELDKLTEDNADKITLNLGFPSKLLLAGGVANRRMKLYGNKVIKKMKKHGFNLSELRNLPEAVAYPIAVFNNLGRDGNRSILTELKTANGNFLVAIDLGKGGDDIDFNIVSSVFGKGKEKVISWIEKGHATYINKRKALDYLHYPAPIAETLSSPRLDTAAKIIENFENPAIREQNNNAEGDEDVRFRDGDFTPRDRAIAAQQYERMLSRGSWQFREATQDSMLGLKSLYEAVLNGANAPGRKQKIRIEDVAGYENAYLYENRMSSANNGEQHQYFSRFMKPLLESIHKLCGSKELDRRILTDYMIAKHGLERNEYMRKEAAANGEDTERDFAGLCGLTGEEDWRVAETVARQMVDDYEADHDTAELWENVKKATNATLEKIYLSGLISEDTYNKVLGMYDFYIPLRGWDETTSDEVYGYLTSKDGPLMGNVFKTARGRNSKADDPIATVAMMADDAIRQGNRNIMKQRFLNFVHGNPSDLVSVNEIWLQHNDVTDEWEPVFADLQPDMTHAEVESEIAKFEAKMEALRTAEPDKYKKGRDARNIPYKVVRGNINEHQVLVKRNGRTYVMTINGNPRAAQALNGLTNPNVETGGVIGDLLKLGEYVNRHLSAFYTTRNPDFVVSNFLRDMLYSNCMTWVKENPRYALCFHKNFGKVNPLALRRLLSKWEKDRLSDSNYLEKMFKEFMLNGGETGYTSVKDIEGHKRTIAKELSKLNKRDVGNRSWRWLVGQLDLFNRSVENCARFAAFLTSREMGRSLDRSIHDAKEVSVNFNKKGSGGKFVNATGQKLLGKIGSYLGGGGRIAFVFWNAGVQGMTNFGRAGKRNPGKALGGAAALFTLGYVIPLLAQMLGGGDGDDDDKNAYYNLPEYVRRSNICFKAGEQWITIPLPIEYRAIYGMGELACGVISGNERYSNSELTRQMASQVSQVMPLDMLEGGGGISPFIPSAFKPMTEAYIMNKGWTGLPVYKDTPYNKNDPEWTKAYQSADQHLVEFTKWVNETTGGDDYKKGILDINPAKLEYLLSGTFGGVVSTTGKLKKMGETALSMREFEWRNMLLANRVIKSGDERTANRKLQNEYFKYLNEYEETNRLRKKYEHAANDGILGYAERADFLYNSAEYLRYGIFEEYKPDIDAIREGIKAETDPEAKKELENELFATMRELVDKLHNVDK